MITITELNRNENLRLIDGAIEIDDEYLENELECTLYDYLDDTLDDYYIGGYDYEVYEKVKAQMNGELDDFEVTNFSMNPGYDYKALDEDHCVFYNGRITFTDGCSKYVVYIELDNYVDDDDDWHTIIPYVKVVGSEYTDPEDYLEQQLSR